LRLGVLSIGIQPPAEIASSKNDDDQQGDRGQPGVGENGFGAVLKGFPDFVLLEFLA